MAWLFMVLKCTGTGDGSDKQNTGPFSCLLEACVPGLLETAEHSAINSQREALTASAVLFICVKHLQMDVTCLLHTTHYYKKKNSLYLVGIPFKAGEIFFFRTLI